MRRICNGVFPCASANGRSRVFPSPLAGNVVLESLLPRRSCARSGSSSSSPQAPLILVLDLDETLIRPKIRGLPAHAKRQLSHVDFSVTIKVQNGVQCDISLRPGLTQFFEWIKQRRSAGIIDGPWLFGQGVEAYIDAILPKLDPGGEIFEARVLSQKACTVAKVPGYVLKDLCKVSDMMDGSKAHIPRMVLVDNNAVSAIMYPDNSLLVRDWKSDPWAGGPDRELARVSTLIDSLVTDECDHDIKSASDYAARLVAATPGHARFRERLRGLNTLLNTELPKKEQLHQRLIEVWKESCDIKRELLGLQPGED